MNLRDNPDGTCNCRPLGDGCFFTDGLGGRCDCKCHQPMPNFEEFDREFENIKSKFLSDIEYGRKEDGLHVIDFQNIKSLVHSHLQKAYERGRRDEKEEFEKCVVKVIKTQ